MVKLTIWDNKIELETQENLFSPRYADNGSLAMLKNIQFTTNDKVLDLGCGYGLVGISIAKVIGAKNVYMVDNDINAIKMAKENMVLNSLSGISIKLSDSFAELDNAKFTLILSNPPYHENFNVARSFIEKGFKHLELNGKMVIVVKRLKWYKNKMISVYGGVKIIEENGYYVLISEKKSYSVNKIKPIKKINKKHAKRLGL